MCRTCGLLCSVAYSSTIFGRCLMNGCHREHEADGTELKDDVRREGREQ